MPTFQINLDVCGFGYSKGLLPEIRLGLLRITLIGKPIVESYTELRDDLRVAHAGLRMAERQIKKMQFDNEQLVLQLEAETKRGNGLAEYIANVDAAYQKLAAKLAPYKRARDPITGRIVRAS